MRKEINTTGVIALPNLVKTKADADADADADAGAGAGAGAGDENSDGTASIETQNDVSSHLNPSNDTSFPDDLEYRVKPFNLTDVVSTEEEGENDEGNVGEKKNDQNEIISPSNLGDEGQTSSVFGQTPQKVVDADEPAGLNTVAQAVDAQDNENIDDKEDENKDGKDGDDKEGKNKDSENREDKDNGNEEHIDEKDENAYEGDEKDEKEENIDNEDENADEGEGNEIESDENKHNVGDVDGHNSDYNQQVLPTTYTALSVTSTPVSAPHISTLNYNDEYDNGNSMGGLMGLFFLVAIGAAVISFIRRQPKNLGPTVNPRAHGYQRGRQSAKGNYAFSGASSGRHKKN